MSRVDLTNIQFKAVKLLKTYMYVLLYGGSRSGKTRIIIEYIVRMCMKYPEMRAFIARQAQSHARASVWQETLYDVLSSYRTKYPDQVLFKVNESDMIIKFVNGSRLYVAGLDDKERVEKILGRGFAIEYLNECSQIAYNSYNIVKTRLAQKIEGFTNVLFADENPPAPTHWTHKIWIEKIDPKTGDPLMHAEKYASMLMNPADNMENLPDDYLETLKSLPDREIRRFLYGEFVKVEGAIYDSFDEVASVINIEDIPTFDSFAVGIDNTGNNLAALLIGFRGDEVYCLDEVNMYRENHTVFNAEVYKKWAQYNYVAYCDPAAGGLNDFVWNNQKTDNAVESGINCVREKMEFNNFFYVRDRVPTLISQLQSYHMDDKGRVKKVDDHQCDCLRYAVYNYTTYGASIILR